MADGDTDQHKDRVARITAVVAIVVALIGGAASVGTAIYTVKVQSQASRAESERTNRLQAYARFNDAEQDLQRVSDAYEATGVQSNLPVDFQRIDDLYNRSEASYTTVQKALDGILAVGSEDMKVIAGRLCATERKKLDALYVDPRGGVIPGYPGDGSAYERPSEKYDRIKKDADQSYDQFIRQAGQELMAR